MDTAGSGLADLLALEQIDRDLFRGRCHEAAPLRAFGGQVAAQALTAAGRTVDNGRYPHSLHGYFMRPGDPRRPIVYQVERLRDGRSYLTRRVTGLQNGEAIFNLSTSFKLPEDSPARQIPMPVTPAPDQLPDAFRDFAEASSGFSRAGFPHAISLRVAPASGLAPDGSAEQRLWLRSAEVLPDDPMLHMCALTYASDLMLARVAALALKPPASSVVVPGVSAFRTTSLDHAVWFHRRFRVDDWILAVQRSPSAGDGRGLVCADFWTRDGRLVASVVQETLLRPRR